MLRAVIKARVARSLISSALKSVICMEKSRRLTAKRKFKSLFSKFQQFLTNMTKKSDILLYLLQFSHQNRNRNCHKPRFM